TKEGPRRGNIKVEQEQLRDGIVEHAMQLHRRQGGKGLRVHVSFAEDTDFRKRDIQPMANTLASFVPSNVSRARFLPLSKECPEWLRSIYVLPRPKFLRDVARWDVAHGGCMQAAEDSLPKLIRQKESKLSAYRKA